MYALPCFHTAADYTCHIQCLMVHVRYPTQAIHKLKCLYPNVTVGKNHIGIVGYKYQFKSNLTNAVENPALFYTTMNFAQTKKGWIVDPEVGDQPKTSNLFMSDILFRQLSFVNVSSGLGLWPDRLRLSQQCRFRPIASFRFGYVTQNDNVKLF